MVMELTPEWLKLEEQLGGRSRLEGTPDEMQAQFDGLIQLLSADMPPPDAEVTRTEKVMDGTRTLVFTPAASVAGGNKLPLIVWCHGGGYILGSPETEAPIGEVLAKHTPAVVVSVDYRLGPTHKHPSALEDCEKVFKYARAHADELGADASKMLVGGGSAGGGLALGVTSRIVADPSTRSHIQGTIAVVPVSLHPDNVPAQLKNIYTSYDENGVDAPVINKTSMMQFYQAVNASPTDDGNFAALATSSHKHFPPTYFAACGADPLRDDSVVMEKLLKEAGVKTKFDMYPKLPHYFWIFASIPQGQEFIGNLIQGSKFVLGA